MATFHLELPGGLMFVPLLLILILGGVVAVVVIAVQRSSKENGDESDGADIVAYLVLALAMSVAGFAVAALATIAFPVESVVFDSATSLATALAALVVSAPFAFYFWLRQERRRVTYPDSAGWAFYLAAIEVVFLTAFVVSAVMFLDGLLTERTASGWPRALVFGAVLVFHEYAATVTPPQSEAGELRRVIGSAIAIITTAIGATGLLIAVLSSAYEGFGGTVASDFELHPWLSMVIIGTPIWWYRWLRPWSVKPGISKLTWAVLVSVASLASAIGAATAIVVQIVEFMFGGTPPAGEHFDPLPITLSLVLVGLPVWLVHRHVLAEEGGNPLRLYRYTMAAIGLAAAVSMAIALTIAVFDRSLIVGATARDIITLAVVLVVGLAVWLGFERGPTAEIAPWPRKLYTLGVGGVFGLVAAGALITTLFVLLRRLLDDSEQGSLLEPTTVFVYTGLAAWYLLDGYFRERRAEPERETVAPFDVTVICSHPGPLATLFPDQARLRVWYRGDDLGVVSAEMASEIVDSVANTSSYVWVEGDAFRVGPIRP